MKTIKSAVLLSVLALAPLGLKAQEVNVTTLPPVIVTPEADSKQAYLSSFSREPGTLYPTAITVPFINGIYASNSVELLFNINSSGRPEKMQVVKNSTDMGLAVLVMNAVRDWQFSPAMRDGAAIPSKASLVVTVTSKEARDLADPAVRAGPTVALR